MLTTRNRWQHQGLHHLLFLAHLLEAYMHTPGVVHCSLSVNWFTDFFIEDLGTEDEIKIKIKYMKST